MIQVHSTTDYKIFKKLKGNRPLDKGHLFRLTAAILENNLLIYHPAMVNEQMQVVDGQHRLEVAKNNNLPFYYMVFPSNGSDVLITQNRNVKVWSSNEYLNFWIAQDKEDYLKLQEFMNDNKLSVTLSMALLTGTVSTTDRKSGHLRSFRDGQFKIKNIDFANDLIIKMAGLRPYMTSNFIFDRDLWAAFAKIVVKGDWQRFSKKLEQAHPRLVREAGYSQYLFALEEIYNRNVEGGNRVNFR